MVNNEKNNSYVIDLTPPELNKDKTKEKILGNEFHDEYLQIMGEYPGDAGREIMLQNLLTRINQEGELSDKDSDLKFRILNKLDDIIESKKENSESVKTVKTKKQHNEIDEINNIETADVQSDRIKAELEKLRNGKDKILSDKSKSDGAKIRGCRRMDREINELEDKLKHFEVEEDEEIIELTDEVKDEETLAELEKENPELGKMAKEVVDEVENMPEQEKKKWHENIGNLGYRISGYKNEKMSEIMTGISKLSGKDNIAGKYFNNYSKNYKKLSENDKKSRDTIGKGVISSGAGTGKGFGILFKYGRALYDLGYLNPLRHITAAAMILGKSSEVLKETRLESESAQQKTRIGEEDEIGLYNAMTQGRTEDEVKKAEKELDKDDYERYKQGESDMDRVMEEAWSVYEKAQKQNNGKAPSKEQLKEAYAGGLPEDIQKRFARGEFSQTKWYKIYINKSKSVKYYADKLSNKLEKIEKNKKLTNEEKTLKRNNLLARNEALVNDLDKMVGDAGAIDTVAYASRVAEKFGKGVATVMIFDSIRMLAEGAWNMRNIFDKYGDGRVKITQPEVKTFKISPLPEEIKDTGLEKEPLAGAEKAPVESLKEETKTVGVEDAPIQEPVQGAPKEVVGELKETVKKQEVMKNIAAKVAEQEAAMAEHGLKKSFTLTLGENGTPARLERTMHMIAMNAMDDEKMYTGIKGGVKLFDEEPAARSLNVAANLTKMAEGELDNIKGVEISNEMKESFSFDKKTGQLEIKNYAEFNNLVKNLHTHAENLWDNKILEKEAVGYLDRIKGETWQDIIEANGLEEKGVDGHDNLDVKIQDFKNSEMVQKAEGIIKARETRALADSEVTEALQEKKPKEEAPYKIFEAKFESPERYLNNFLGLSETRVSGTAMLHEELSAYDPGFKKQLLSRVEELTGSDLSEKSIGEQANLINLKTALTVEEMTKGYSEINQAEHIKFIREHYHLYKSDSITEIYKQMPDSIRGNGEQALNYLNLKAGNNEEKATAIKNIFNLKNKPGYDLPYGFTQDSKTEIITVNVDDGKRILVDLKNNKVGVQIEGVQKNLGIKSVFLGLGKRTPTMDLTMENLKGVKEFLGIKNEEWVAKGVKSVEEESSWVKKGVIAK